jgi:hypothetical protein
MNARNGATSPVACCAFGPTFRLAGELLPERLDDPRLADPGLA